MKFKRLASVVVGAAVLMASMSVSAVDFADVKGHWSESYVNAMVENGYIKGYEDGTFRPDQTISNTEALILLSRMLGVESSEYAQSAKNALSAYSSVLSRYDTDYKNEVAYLLYRGVISTSDLDTYISDSNKNNALLRYQCAILITKLLGAQEEVQGSVFISSSYSDTAEIPSEARPYVEYVRDAKIMEGMGYDSYGDPIFGPLHSVTRGQMAKMLSSLINELNITSVTGTIQDVSGSSIDVENNTYEIADKTIVKVNGGDADISDLDEGMDVMVTVVRGEVSMIEAYAVASPVIETVKGVIVSASTASTGKSITVSDPGDSTDRTTYDVDDDVKVLINKAVDAYSRLKKDQYVELTVKNGIVSQIEVIDKEESIAATLVSVNLNSKTPTVTVEDIRGNRTTYTCSADGVSVSRNNLSANLNELVVGDNLTLRLSYSEVVKITATSATQTMSGKISYVTHTESGSKLGIDVDDKTSEYSVSSSATIKIDGTDSTVYNLRPGSSIQFKADSTMITRIETSSSVARTSITGKVTAVQSSYNLLFVEEGGREITIVVNSSTNIIKSTSGSTMKLSGINVGDDVTITGSNATGVFVATVIIVQ